MAEHVHWNLADTGELIKCFQREEELWDVRNPNYSKREGRQRALERVKEEMENKFTVEEINKKIIHLRSYYGRELAKVRKAQKSGASTDDVYTSKWPFFHPLDQFLRSQITPRGSESKSNDDEEEIYIDIKREFEIDGPGCSITPVSTQRTKKRKLSGSRAVVADAVSVLSQIKAHQTQTLREPVSQDLKEDETLTFARYISNEIQKISDMSIRNTLKLDIQKQIFDAQKEDRLLTEESLWRLQLVHNDDDT